jgi:exodeoxyribonuclease VII small subunit
VSNTDTVSSEATSFRELKARLDEIVELVSDDSLPLEEALKYYEEAVGLGLEASNILEQGINANTAEHDLAQEQAGDIEEKSEETVDISAGSTR